MKHDARVGVGRREVRGAAVRTGREPRGRTDSVPVVLDRTDGESK